MLFAELSWTPHRTHDVAYINAFGATDDYTPAARAAGTGGPLGRTGILFEGAGLGAYAPVLGNRASRVAGGAAGYQRFFDDTRSQLVLEFGLRKQTGGSRDLATAFGSRFQRALGRRLIVRLDGFVANRDGEDLRFGGRAELRVKF